MTFFLYSASWIYGWSGGCGAFPALSTPHCQQPVWSYWVILHFGQLFKASGNNYFAQIDNILGIFCKGNQKLSFFLWNHLGNFYWHLTTFYWSHCINSCQPFDPGHPEWSATHGLRLRSQDLAAATADNQQLLLFPCCHRPSAAIDGLNRTRQDRTLLLVGFAAGSSRKWRGLTSGFTNQHDRGWDFFKKSFIFNFFVFQFTIWQTNNSIKSNKPNRIKKKA